MQDGTSKDSTLPVAALARVVTASRAQTIALPSASALIDLTPRTSLFLRYQQGLRPGGLAVEDDFVRRFRSDRVATVEAGFRAGRPSRDPVDLSVTVARTAWRDIQADFLDGAGLSSTANIGDGRLWTIEANVGAKIAEELRLERAASYNDNPTWSRWFAAAGAPEPIDPPLLRFSEESRAIQAAVAGQGIALVSLALVREELAAGQLVQPFGPTIAGFRHHLLTREGETRAAVASVAQWLLSEAEALA